MMRMLLALAGLVTPAAAAASPPALPSDPPVIDQLVVHKAARTLEGFAAGRLVWRAVHIQLGFAPTGAKHFQGDGRTPEGRYFIKGANPASGYDLSLHISYPNASDAAYARWTGRDPGGAIFIHGQPNDWSGSGRAPGDWTDGCIALSNAEIEALWRITPDGTLVDIEP